MSFNQVHFRDLILETKDGDWGKDEEKAGFVPYRVIRGGDFPNVEIGTISKVPTCYLKKSTVVRRTLKAGDLLIETAGGTKKKPTGRVIYISQELLDKFNLPVTCASFARFIRIDENKVNPKFIFWYLRNMYEKGEMWQHQVQHTGVARFQWTKFADGFKFDLPTRARQNEIVEVLDTLQKKIRVNLKINQTLESMAQAIFKSWFVDFEPVKAKIAAIEAGEETEGVTRAAMRAISGKTDDELDQMQAGQPENYAKLKTTAELFPSSMQDSELGEVPEGGEVKLNGEIMDVRDGTHDSPKKSDRGFPLLTSKHITSGTLMIDTAYLISQQDYENVNKRSKVNQGDILLTMIGTVGIPYLVMQREVNFAIKNVGLFRTSDDKYLKNYFYFLLKSEGMQKYLEARVAGTTQKYLSLKTLRSIDLLVPSDNIIDCFNQITNPLLDYSYTLNVEAKHLAQLRDTLLPKLLSGELSVDVIEMARGE